MSESPLASWRGGDLSAAPVARVGAVAALAGSAAVHATVIREHLEEWPVAGLFFLLVTLAELLLAAAVIGAWSRRTAIAVTVVSVGTVAVWLVSRTVGLPVGPAELHAPEAVGVPDLACCVLELAAAALVAPWALGHSAWRRRAPGGSRRGGVAAATVLVAALGTVTAWGLASSLGGSDASDHGHDEHAESHLRPAG